jgi:hypothetical protein
MQHVNFGGIRLFAGVLLTFALGVALPRPALAAENDCVRQSAPNHHVNLPAAPWEESSDLAVIGWIDWGWFGKLLTICQNSTATPLIDANSGGWIAVGPNGELQRSISFCGTSGPDWYDMPTSSRSCGSLTLRPVKGNGRFTQWSMRGGDDMLIVSGGNGTYGNLGSGDDWAFSNPTNGGTVLSGGSGDDNINAGTVNPGAWASIYGDSGKDTLQALGGSCQAATNATEGAAQAGEYCACRSEFFCDL